MKTVDVPTFIFLGVETEININRYKNQDRQKIRPSRTLIFSLYVVVTGNIRSNISDDTFILRSKMNRIRFITHSAQKINYIYSTLIFNLTNHLHRVGK